MIKAAIAEIPNGASVMLGGFGVPGTPFCLIDELVRQGQTGLTIIKNDANETGMGVDHLLKNAQVARLITTHIGLNARAIEMMNAGDLKVEFCAQGILAELHGPVGEIAGHRGGQGRQLFDNPLRFQAKALQENLQLRQAIGQVGKNRRQVELSTA